MLLNPFLIRSEVGCSKPSAGEWVIDREYGGVMWLVGAPGVDGVEAGSLGVEAGGEGGVVGGDHWVAAVLEVDHNLTSRAVCHILNMVMINVLIYITFYLE